MSDQVTQLRVGDENFLVASMIERCPKVMMLRELVKNAIEAAATAPAGQRQVRLSALPVEGVPKLAIWNSGRGMDADELFRMCDIASSIRKEHRLDQNFGMGAKVASLPSNRHGLRYRSCHDGVVHEVMLGYRDGIYGRLRRAGPDGAWHDVLEATEAAVAEGRDPGADWTEVVLLGNAAAQDTVRDPYQGAPPMEACWLAEELGYKFFRIRDEVEVLLEASGRRFEPLMERIPRDYSRHSAVTLPDGVALHYVYDAPLPDEPSGSTAGRNALFPAHGACGLVYKDELYDVHRRQNWLHVAPVFGIPFGARAISVFVELPDGHGIIPDGYRQFVRYAGGAQGQVACRHFALQIHQNRPRWLIDIINDQAPSMRVSNEIYDDLNRLLRDLGVRRRRRLIPATAAPSSPSLPRIGPEPARHPPGAGPEGAASRPAPVRHGLLDESRALEDDPDGEFDAEPSPEILMLRDDQEIAARGVSDRAGRYYPETHQLFLNGLYPAVQAMQALLQGEFGASAEAETVRRHAQALAEQSMAARVGRMLVFALAKQGKWSDQEVSQAYSVQALSLLADDFAQSLPAARASLRATLDALRPDTAEAA